MKCPKCQFESETQTTECLKCGVVFKKVAHRTETPAVEPVTPSSLSEPEPASASESNREFLYRLFALPLALIASRAIVAVAPNVRLLTMWVHEGGHAVTAWLSGFGAIPGPWVTQVEPERSAVVTLMVTAIIGFGGYQGWRWKRWGLLVLAVVALLMQISLRRLFSDQAMAAVTFGGDGGCFVLGALLMISMYADQESALVKNQLRWGLLVIGALAFMDAYAIWTGGLATIPIGENENGMSDPSVLTEMYGWPMQMLIQRYNRLANICLVALAGVYVYGLIAVRSREPEPQLQTAG
jgi:hypothetical protein